MIPLLLSSLQSLGFVPGNAIGKQGDLSDQPIQGLIAYLTREWQGQWQYISLLSAHDDPTQFIGTVTEVFAAPRNSRAKWVSGKGGKRRRELSGLVGVHYSAPATLPDLLVALDHVYPLTPADQ